MRAMKESVLSVLVVVAASLQDVKADGGPDQSGAIGGVIGFAIFIAVCAICCYKRCCQRTTVVREAAPAAAAAATTQNVQHIHIVSPPNQQFVPTHQQQPMMSPAGAYAPMPTMADPNAPPQFGAPPPSYFAK